MKKRFKTFSILLIILVFIISIFIKSYKLTNIITLSINIFIKNILPFLFPMFIISSILIELNLPFYLGKIFNKPISILFKTNKHSAFVFFMSIITGFPSSAKTLDDLINKKVINKDESEKILTFTFFSNPLFIIGTIGINIFKSKEIGLYILLSHIIGNILTGIILRNYKTNIENNSKYISNNNYNIFDTINKSIKNTIDILINIFAILTLSLIIINIIFNNPNNIFEIFLTGLIEMTSGLKYLEISNLYLNIKLYMSVFFISFGGLSIHMQIFNILKKRKVKYLPFLLSRIIHSILSILILFIIIQMDRLF